MHKGKPKALARQSPQQRCVCVARNACMQRVWRAALAFDVGDGPGLLRVHLEQFLHLSRRQHLVLHGPAARIASGSGTPLTHPLVPELQAMIWCRDQRLPALPANTPQPILAPPGQKGRGWAGP